MQSTSEDRTPAFLYLAQGRLFIKKNPEREAQRLESPFVQGIEDRRQQEREKRGFDRGGLMWNVANRPEMSALATGLEPQRLLRFTGMSPGNSPDDIYYALQTEAIGGLLQYTIRDGYERRLLHRKGLELRDLARSPQTGELACSIRVGEGACNIALMDHEGRGLREVTHGDSIDEAPSWVPGNNRALVYQSAGIGRHENGAAWGLGPYAIWQLDLEAGETKSRHQSPQFDLLSPRLTANGALYYIRRPYQPHPPVSVLRFAGDVLLFPFRLGRAAVHFLDAFSRFFSNKPLFTAGGPHREGPNAQYLQLWGRWIDVRRTMGGGPANSEKALVPGNWQLIRVAPDGTEASVASHVVAYDVAPDGDILYTNGSAVYYVRAKAPSIRVANARLIERVALLN